MTRAVKKKRLFVVNSPAIISLLNIIELISVSRDKSINMGSEPYSAQVSVTDKFEIAFDKG